MTNKDRHAQPRCRRAGESEKCVGSVRYSWRCCPILVTILSSHRSAERKKKELRKRHRKSRSGKQQQPAIRPHVPSPTPFNMSISPRQYSSPSLRHPSSPKTTWTMLLLFIIVSIFSVAPLSVLAGDPEVTVSRIDNLPNRLFYFDDTPVSTINNWTFQIG